MGLSWSTVFILEPSKQIFWLLVIKFAPFRNRNSKVFDDLKADKLIKIRFQLLKWLRIYLLPLAAVPVLALKLCGRDLESKLGFITQSRLRVMRTPGTSCRHIVAWETRLHIAKSLSWRTCILSPGSVVLFPILYLTKHWAPASTMRVWRCLNHIPSRSPPNQTRTKSTFGHVDLLLTKVQTLGISLEIRRELPSHVYRSHRESNNLVQDGA